MNNVTSIARKDWYYYLDIEGNLQGLNPKALDDVNAREFFDNDHVVKWWLVNENNRAHAWEFLIDASKYGAQNAKVFYLLKKWQLTNKDAKQYAKIKDYILVHNQAGFFVTKYIMAEIKHKIQGHGPTAFSAFVDYERKVAQ